MRFKTKQRIFFFQLEENTLNRLKDEVEKNNILHPKGDMHIKISIAGFFVNLIDKRRTLLGEDADDGYVNLMSEILKKYYYDYPRYIRFLEENGFIEVRNGYSTFKGKSKQYKLVSTKEPVRIIQWFPKDNIISKKITYIESGERKRADRSCGHLTKWLHPQYLSIKYSEAINYVDSLQYQGCFSEGHYSKRLQRIELIDKGYISYKREGNDKRLHSVLTNMPKDLRPYLLFQNEHLISLDIKSSQPFMLAGLINLVIRPNTDKVVNECINEIKGFKRRNHIRVNINMWKENLSSTDIPELKAYIKIVLEDDIYDYVGRNFSTEFLKKKLKFGGYKDKFYCKHKEIKKFKFFNNSRDYAKVTFLEYLYSSPNNTEERIKEVKRILPKAVTDFVNILKKNVKNDFPIFLQNLESYIVIDKVTKEFSKKYPNVPLYTIHDSVATTEKYVQPLQVALERDIKDFFGIMPKIVSEDWFEDPSEAA